MEYAGVAIPEKGLTPAARHPELEACTDADILRQLRTYRPLTSQRNVWTSWDTGLDNIPPWCLRNIINWVRRLGPTWTVRVVDCVEGSPNEIYQYVAKEHFPTAFNERRIDGKDKGQKTSDLLRLPLLYHYGGVYMDVSVILFRSLDDICWGPIEDPESRFRVAAFEYKFRAHFGQFHNAFLACMKGDPFIRKWHEIFCELWRGRTNVQGSNQHPLIRHLGLVALDDPGMEGLADASEITDYLAPWMSYERLRLLEEPGDDGFDGAGYFREHFFLLSSWEEMFLFQDRMQGDEQFKLLSLKYEPHRVNEDPNQAMASDFVNGLLTRSSVAKFGEGYWLEGMPYPLSKLWRETPGSDCVEGTWAGYLRYASVHLDQTRSHGVCLEPLVIPEEKDEIHNVGYLQPVGVGGSQTMSRLLVS